MEPLSEAERRDLLRLIEQRKNELAEKRKLLDSLGVSAASQRIPNVAAEVSVPAASTLMDDVMSAMQQAQANAATVSPKVASEVELAKSGRKDGDAARYSRALKRVVGPLTTTSAAVDVIIVPKSMDHFDKSCQCDIQPPIEVTTPKSPPPPSNTHVSQGRGAKVPAAEIKNQKVTAVTAEVPNAAHKTVVLSKETQAPLSEEEKKKLIYSTDFENFFAKASRAVERALGESELFDVFADYSQLKPTGEERTSKGGPIRKLETYVDQRWSSKRPILDLRTHPKFPEIFVVSYGQKRDASLSDPDGCALIWNIAMPQRAEYVFTCQSQVCTAMFDSYRPNHVIGGTFTGSIVLWDTRAKTRPVQRTPLSPKAHHHSVYSMHLVGTEHAHNLVTIDLDGRLCLWSLAMLVQPTETIDLKRNRKDVACLCSAFAEGENNAFMGGAEDGSLYQVQIHGNKGGVTESYTGHVAPVTGLHWHPANENKALSAEAALDCSDLLLSSSYDWSVKLWSPKSSSVPLHSFEASDDYCTSVEWHPYNPSVFGSVQADGGLNIWDIAGDIEAPSVSQSVGADALTKLKWSNDGSRLKTGDATGGITMWGVSNEISQPRQDDISRLTTIIEDLKNTERATEDV